MFTVYIKDLGPWTKALKNTALGAEATGNATSLLVDVDGFYSQVQSLNSMKVAAGAPRVVIVAGGSGMTSLMGFIQVRSSLKRLSFAVAVVGVAGRLASRSGRWAPVGQTAETAIGKKKKARRRLLSFWSSRAHVSLGEFRLKRSC